MSHSRAVCAYREAARTRTCKLDLEKTMFKVVQEGKEHNIWIGRVRRRAERW